MISRLGCGSEEVEEIDPEQFEYFYEHNGDVVTGSGADTWGLYRPGMLNEMTKLVSTKDVAMY